MNPLPPGPFDLILSDPPWRFATRSEKGRGRSPDGRVTNDHGNMIGGPNNDPARHYETMPLDEIKALPVQASAAKDCLLALWAVDPMLQEALDVGAAWGFKYKTVALYWAKTRKEGSTRGKDLDGWDKHFPMGTGYWTRANPEMCLLFTRGAPKRAATDVRKLIVAPRREHSRKPEEMYGALERLVGDVNRLEMFGRASRPGWTVWGDQSTKFDDPFSLSSRLRSLGDAAERMIR